jgi:hypothetical protein
MGDDALRLQRLALLQRHREAFAAIDKLGSTFKLPNFPAIDFESLSRRARSVAPEQPRKPPSIVRFARLKGYGEETIDLDQCVRFTVGVPAHPGAHHFDPSTVTVYYLTPDHRGIIGFGGLLQANHGGAGYREIHPLEIAHAFYMLRKALPPELERYQPFLQPDLTLPQMISAWEQSLASRIQDDVEPTRTTIAPPTTVASPSAAVDAGLITIKAACKLTGLSKGYISKLCSKDLITNNGVNGRGRRLSAASLAEFLESRETEK